MIDGPGSTRRDPFIHTQPYAGTLYAQGCRPLTQHASTVFVAITMKIMESARRVNPVLVSDVATIRADRIPRVGASLSWIVELQPLTLDRQAVEIRGKLLEAIGQTAVEAMLKEMADMMERHGISASAIQQEQLTDRVSFRLVSYRL